MVFNSVLGSVVYRVIAWALVVAVTGTSTMPVAQRLPRATAAYLPKFGPN
jgi:hypothetical protein